jgi:hypothetical protein
VSGVTENLFNCDRGDATFFTVCAKHLIKFLYVLGANMRIRPMHHRPRRHDSGTVFGYLHNIGKKFVWKSTTL